MAEQGSLMVLVTMQRACARLIRFGADQAMIAHRPLHVVHVTPREGADAPQAETLNYLYALAGESGATMCVLRSDVAVNAMAEYAAQNGVSTVLMGGGEQAQHIARTLSELTPGVEVHILPEEA